MSGLTVVSGLRVVSMALVVVLLGTTVVGAQDRDTRPLRTLWVTVQTSNERDAGTDDDFKLLIQKRFTLPSYPVIELNPADLRWDENEDGRTELYRLDVRQQELTVRDVTAQSTCIEILGGDGWLLQSLWIVGETTSGEPVLLVAQPRWPTDGWLSTDRDEGEPVRSAMGGPGCLIIT